MNARISEIKCPIHNPENIRTWLLDHNADFKGVDKQTDTYFHVNAGRLKLREGNIENTLIRYFRPETTSIKQSDVLFQPLSKDVTFGLKQILKSTLGIWKIVEKQRSIYFIDNVKFHIDKVTGLGDFIEIEAIDTDNQFTTDELKKQCSFYINQLDLDPSTFIDKSYSDMVLP